MARKALIRSNIYPYHITARVNNRENFPLPMPEMWTLVTNELYLIQLLFEVTIQAFVLMPNHLHLIISTPNSEHDLGKVMNYFMSSLTLSTHRKTGRSGRLFGARYYWSIILSSRYYGHVLKYVYRNPVRKGICDKVEEYEFTTLGGLIGQRHLPFPIHFTECGLDFNIPDPNDHIRWVEWLNIPFPKEAEKLIQKFLLKKEINVLVCRNLRKPVAILEQLL